MYFAACLVAIQWIARGCYFYLLLILDYYFVEFGILYLFEIIIDLNLFLCLSWPMLAHCVM